MTRGDLDSRIGPLPHPDLAALATHADRLAQALEQARTDRTRLQHQVIARADAERQASARDLHDEMGPCLFGLRVEADALREAAPDPATAASADQIAAIAEQIARVNRTLLDDLRPMAVGQLPLATVLADYVADLEPPLSGHPLRWTWPRACPNPRGHRADPVPHPAGGHNERPAPCPGGPGGHPALDRSGALAHGAGR